MLERNRGKEEEGGEEGEEEETEEKEEEEIQEEMMELPASDHGQQAWRWGGSSS